MPWGRLGGSTLFRSTSFMDSRECPICKNTFRPPKETLFKLREGRRVTYFCSWSCLRKAEKAKAANTKVDWSTKQERIRKMREEIKSCKKKLAIREAEKKKAKLAGDKRAFGSLSTSVAYYKKKIRDLEDKINLEKGESR